MMITPTPFKTFEETYANLKEWYDSEYPVLERDCQEMDRYKGDWYRLAKQLALPHALRDMKASEGAEIVQAIDTRLQKMDEAKQKAFTLLAGMEEGVRFAKPFHSYAKQTKPADEVKQIESQINEIDKKSKLVSILYHYLDDRIPKARFEGNAVKDFLILGRSDRAGAFVNYWLGRDPYQDRVRNGAPDVEFDHDAVPLETSELDGSVNQL